VFVRYCDGESFTGDVEAVDREYLTASTNFSSVSSSCAPADRQIFYLPTDFLQEPATLDGILFSLPMQLGNLLAQGMNTSQNAVLSGCSAGGLATILHCDNFRTLLPKSAKVKCFSDAGYFVDLKDISGKAYIEQYFNDVVTLHALEGEIGTSPTRGYYINSCFSHCQTQEQAYWFGPNSPTLLNKTIAEAVGDWVLDRNQFR
ncbi:hypothetical protein HAX54_016049, partial [Datura stramonium]|nr:hypothetical protein [Datura stramonium]